MKDKKKGTMILDLSNPRTVDEKVATIPGIKLMNIRSDCRDGGQRT